jgi:hypothetical protein
MKNISPSTLPNFNGLSTKDPYAFPFEFHALCRSYDYKMDAYKINLFLATLNNEKLHWFIGLGGKSIHTW